ncbi:MAG: response regulator [Nitriliruptorales bacterium]|nr:response regulator [Nitriliruptorales bacterium]
MRVETDNDTATIAVVEDEDDLANLVRVNLELSGYDVVVAKNGAEGLTAIKNERPDLVLLDVMMPVLDGWQVLRSLKEDDELRDIPVIMLTALSEERDLIRGHLQGAVRYVTKPFEMKTLLEAVEDGLSDPDEEELDRRRQQTKDLLQRLAELDSGRTANGAVRFSKLEAPPDVKAAEPRITDAERQRVESLTEKQHYLASQLARGRSAREMAEELDVSRSNVYATRKRIARKLGVAPGEVAEEAARLGLDED